MRCALILNFDGISYYGSIPNAPYAPDERVDETCFLEEGDWDLLDADFIDSVNDACGTLLDLCDVDYFDKIKCIKLKEWLENKLSKNIHHRLREIYTKLLEYATRAIELDTGIVIEC